MKTRLSQSRQATGSASLTPAPTLACIAGLVGGASSLVGLLGSPPPSSACPSRLSRSCLCAGGPPALDMIVASKPWIETWGQKRHLGRDSSCPWVRDRRNGQTGIQGFAALSCPKRFVASASAVALWPTLPEEDLLCIPGATLPAGEEL